MGITNRRNRVLAEAMKKLIVDSELELAPKILAPVVARKVAKNNNEIHNEIQCLIKYVDIGSLNLNFNK